MRGGQWVPNAARTPTSTVPTDAVMRRQAAATLSKEQGTVDVAHRGLTALDEFDAINDRLRPRGGVINSVANSVRRYFGNADLDRLDQLSKGFARQQGAQEKGSISNYEGRMFEGMVGGANRPYAANQAFSTAAHRQSQEIIDRHQFRDEYVKAHGSLVGSDAAYATRKRQAPPSTRKKPVASSGGWTVTEGQ